MFVSAQRDDASKWALLGLARFLLAFVVMTGHIGQFVTTGHGWTKWGLWLNQGSAVFGFLLISGYSIAASLTKSLKGFYVRRVLRIFPIYILAIFLALITGFLAQENNIFPNGDGVEIPTVTQIIGAILMLQTIATPPIATNGSLWTLSIEWWNYMISPLLSKAPSLLIAALAAASLIYNLQLHPADVSKLGHGQTFLCISWYWLVGFLYYRHRRRPWGYAILFFPLLVGYSSGIFMGYAVIIGIMAIALCDEITVPQQFIKAMNWLGDISYPIYAFQIPIMIICNFWHLHHSVIICAITLVISAFAHSWVELPIHILLRRKLWIKQDRNLVPGDANESLECAVSKN